MDVTATLSHESSADITVMLSAAAVAPATANDFTLSGDTLTFKVGDKTSTGEVTLTATDDDVDGADDSKQVTVTGTGPLGRSDITVAPVTLTITDNDTRGVTLTLTEGGQPIPPEGLSITEGDTGSYKVVLDSEPTATVTIAVESSETTVSVAPTSLMFTTANSPQTVTIRTEDDLDGDDLTATITHTVTGGDYEDNNVSAADVAVTVTDDDSPSTGAALSVNPTAVGEGAGRTVTVTATLNQAVLQQPTEVTVSVTSGTAGSDTDFAAVQDFPLTIPMNAESGTTPFTLTPVNDDIDEPNETVTVSGTATALSDGVTATTLTITDNDNPPTLTLVLSDADNSISEGETVHVTATLSHASSALIAVTVSAEPTGSAGAGDFTLSGETLTFTAGDKDQHRHGDADRGEQRSRHPGQDGDGERGGAELWFGHDCVGHADADHRRTTMRRW